MIIKQFKGQTMLEVGMALALTVVIIIGVVSTWAWLNKTMVERLNDYRGPLNTKRLAAIKKIDGPESLLFGHYTKYKEKLLNITLIDSSIDAAPDGGFIGNYTGCEGELNAAKQLAAEPWGKFNGKFRGDIAQKDSEIMQKKIELATSVTVEVFLLTATLPIRIEGPTALGSWLYPQPTPDIDLDTECDRLYRDALTAYNNCIFRHPNDSLEACGQFQPPCDSPDRTIPHNTIADKRFADIDADLRRKNGAVDDLLRDIVFKINGNEASLNDIKTQFINPGKALEEEKKVLQVQADNALRAYEDIMMPAWEAYFACLTREEPHCMGDCGYLADRFKTLLRQAFGTFGSPNYDYAAFDAIWWGSPPGDAIENVARAEPEFYNCFEPCRNSGD